MAALSQLPLELRARAFDSASFARQNLGSHRRAVRPAGGTPVSSWVVTAQSSRTSGRRTSRRTRCIAAGARTRHRNVFVVAFSSSSKLSSRSRSSLWTRDRKLAPQSRQARQPRQAYPSGSKHLCSTRSNPPCALSRSPARRDLCLIRFRGKGPLPLLDDLMASTGLAGAS